jgi:pimeloyl-ACP methyl ester carboxylesterase
MTQQVSIFPVRVRAMDFRLSVRFREDGDNLILFVHGLGCSKDSWRDAWQRPELRGRSLLAFDLPGFGHSACPPGFSADLADYARVLSTLIDAHALRRIHLVAHSMGGSIALLLPPQVLSRLASLVLVEPRLFKSSCGIAAEAAEVSLEEFQRTVFSGMRQRMSGDPHAIFDLDRADTGAFYASSQSLTQWAARRELIERYERADCRKYFIYGAENSHLQELSFVAPASTISIEKAAHFVMQDSPDGFYACLSGIVDSDI